jgi:hypothetical protein
MLGLGGDYCEQVLDQVTDFSPVTTEQCNTCFCHPMPRRPAANTRLIQHPLQEDLWLHTTSDPARRRKVVLSLSGKRREKDPVPESRFHADLRSSRSRSLSFGADQSSMDSWISGN